jgi:glycosyltransferase involved in cell wall biosynthesis
MRPGDRADALAVDVVISNYNYGAYVTAAIDSALRQSHAEVRVIVVDDGSNDDSRERLSAYAEAVELVLQENRGQAAALNAGLERCQGDVVIFLDADDLLRADLAARVAATFATDRAIARVQYRMEVIDAMGEPSGATKPPPGLPMPSGDLRRAELTYPFDLPWLPTSGNAFRRELLGRILPIPEREYPRCGADWHLIHLSTLLGPVASLERIGASYRVHGANNYEPREQRLELAHVRETIAYAGVTTRGLERLADQLGLARPQRILSFSDLGNRLLSRRLAPAAHPRPEDTVVGLVLDGARATRRRTDVSWPMKLVLLAWLIAVAIAPRGLTRWLGELFLFPARRRPLKRRLARLRRRRGGER